ncbi:hypothetical protein AGMMS50229_00770 [Campylobacterota bacterium]|nr:hypothetical protein AGMMS50229_00770 [Campylobacterota bacterium]
MEGKLYEGAINVRTSSVATSFSDLISREKVVPASVDFDISKVETFIKEPNTDNYEPFSKLHVEKLKNSAYILEPTLQIMQDYEIRFKPLVQYPFKLIVSLAVDKFRSGAEAIVKAGSIIKPGCTAAALYAFFNKIKLKNNMLIYILDDELRRSVAELAKQATGEPFKDDLTIVLARWVKPVETVHDKLILHYREKFKVNQEALQINYADRGFLSSVNAGELMVEYILPQAGTNGRDFMGKFLQMPEPNATHAPDFSADRKTVDDVSDTTSRRFIAKTDGFVRLENKILSISNEIEIGEVSLKNTGNIRAGIENNVKIVIGGKGKEDTATEVIAPDMVVEAKEIIANGSVASGGLVIGKKVTITGSTHKKSELIAKEIEVNVLRGTAKGDSIGVKTLEGGTIVSINAHVELAVGGEVSGETVTINNLRGKCLITASKSIILKAVARGDNKLIIDTAANTDDALIVEKAREELAKNTQDISDRRKALAETSSYISKNKGAFKQVESAIKEARSSGQTPSASYVRLAREYLVAEKRLIVENAEIEKIQALNAAIELDMQRFDEAIFNTSVVNEDKIWNGHNEVIFRMPFRGKEFVQLVRDGMRVSRLEMIKTKDGEEVRLVP